MIPNDYNAEAEVIDRQLLELVKQRKALSAGKPLAPGMEILDRWAAEFEMEPVEISVLLNNFNKKAMLRHFNPEPKLLQGVLPIMKRTVDGEFEYMLSHAMQYAENSIVTLEIQYLKLSDERIQIRPALDLVVLGAEPYEVNTTRSGGGGSEIQMQFIVSPPLPEDLSAIEFSLVPGEDSFMGPSYREIKLDKQVDFY